jgi:hypothetical protein
MSLFSRENKRLRMILLGILTAGMILYFAGRQYGNGFVCGTLISVILYESNVRYWNGIADRGHARTGTGIFHFLLHYAAMALVMLAGVYYPAYINIFTAALGLTAVKIALIADELTKRRERL